VESLDLNPIAAALHGSADPEILEGEARIRTAQLRGDAQALASLIDENLLFTGTHTAIAARQRIAEQHVFLAD
jgi:hypothetical protein